jgi:hypothetical protein
MTRAAELGVRVTLKPWPYSKAQLEAASAQLQQEYGWKLNLGFAVRSYLWITPEFAGVEVEGGMPSGKPLSAQQVAGVEAEMAKRVNMPVKLVQTGPPAPLSRTNDFSPYNAGGFMADLSTQTACSSGFSIKLSNGLNYTITARHCDAPAYATFDSYNTGSPLYYGTTTGTQPSAGAARILSGRGSLLTFSGPYNSGGTRQVRDIVNLSVGDAVYTSGGNSGSHGGNIVTGVGTTSDIYGSFPATRAAQTNNSVISAAKGDSGGPVFTLHADGTVAGEGMIQNGAGYVVSNCGAMNVPNVLCYSALYFTTMPTILNSISGGASLVTITNP